MTDLRASDAFERVKREIGLMRMSEVQHGICQHATVKIAEMQTRIREAEDPVAVFIEEETRLLTSTGIRLTERQVLYTALKSLRGYLKAEGIEIPANQEAYDTLERHAEGGQARR